MSTDNYTVFISHSSADAWTAHQIEQRICSCGASTFLSELDVAGGDDFGSWMRDSIAQAQECVVLYTPEAAESRNVWVEIGGAWLQEKRVVMLLCRLTVKDITTDPNFPGYLKSLDFLDLNSDFDKRYVPELKLRIRSTGHGGNDDTTI